MVERQDPDNFTRFQTREKCALEIAAYVFKLLTVAVFMFTKKEMENSIVKKKFDSFHILSQLL